MFRRKGQQPVVIRSEDQPENVGVKTESWTDFEAWLFRTVTGVHHTDPTSSGDAVFDMFFIETDSEGHGILVTPETAAAEMERLREAFGEDYQHIFEAAIPTQEG